MFVVWFYLTLNWIFLIRKVSRRVKSTAFLLPAERRRKPCLPILWAVGIYRPVDGMDRKMVPLTDYPQLFDIGCGPGIYAERFCRQGCQVTGIDFSERPVNYAGSSVLKKGLDITYLYQNYLDMDLHKVFDFATMIYCDYGALSTSDRKKLMGKVYQHLKPGNPFYVAVIPYFFILRQRVVLLMPSSSAAAARLPLFRDRASSSRAASGGTGSASSSPAGAGGWG